MRERGPIAFEKSPNSELARLFRKSSLRHDTRRNENKGTKSKEKKSTAERVGQIYYRNTRPKIEPGTGKGGWIANPPPIAAM